MGCWLQMEYEDVLPYSEFSVRLPQHAIYRLPQVLQDIMDTPGKVLAMPHLNSLSGSADAHC